jgi:hypothetical protein
MGVASDKLLKLIASSVDGLSQTRGILLSNAERFATSSLRQELKYTSAFAIGQKSSSVKDRIDARRPRASQTSKMLIHHHLVCCS